MMRATQNPQKPRMTALTMPSRTHAQVMIRQHILPGPPRLTRRRRGTYPQTVHGVADPTSARADFVFAICCDAERTWADIVGEGK